MLARTYNSYRTIWYKAELPLGIGWMHSYQARIEVVSSGGVALRVFRPNGAIQKFTYNGAAWVGDADVPERLDAAMSGGALVSATYTHADDTVETYDSSGRLIEIRRRDGFKQTLSYVIGSTSYANVQRVTDPEGRSLVFGYTGGFLSSVTDPAGNVITYAYANEDLTSVTYSDGMGATAIRQYHYNEPGQTGGVSMAHVLTGITDESNQRYASWGYDASRRGVLSVHGSYSSGAIDRTDISYNSDGTSTVTDSLGQVRRYGFDVKHRVARLASLDVRCASCGNTTNARSYDANGMLDISTDFAGVTTDQDFNARLLETQRIEAANDTLGRKRTIQTDWDPALRIPIERRLYNASNILVAKTGWFHNSRGQVLTTTTTDPFSGGTRVATNTYCEQSDVTAGTCPLVGLLLSSNGPRTDVADTTAYIYYASDDATCATAPLTCPHRKGDLWREVNAMGHVIETMAYDGAGRPIMVKDSNGVITMLTYHARGWLTSRTVKGATVAEDRSTLIDYWPTGLVKRVTQANGSYTQYTYDAAHRLTDIMDGAGNTIHYTLDNAGNRTAEQARDPGNVLKRSLSRIYDQLGQLQSQSDAYSHATSYTYDANGNTDLATDALGRGTDNTYDPLDRLTRMIQDVAGIAASTQFTYDAQNQLTRVTDPKGLHTDYTYNGLGDLTQLSSPDTGVTGYTYDSGGNRKTHTDARGVTAVYGYDGLNRLTGIAYPNASLNVGYQYDTVNAICASDESYAQGRLTRITDASGMTQYCYNRFGELTRKMQMTGSQVFEVRYHYDAAGRLAGQTYPDGTVLDAVLDGEGRVVELGIVPSGGGRQVVLTGVTYAPFGPSTGWTYGNGRNVMRSLNQNYQPQAIHDADTGGLSLWFEFDEMGNLARLKDAAQSSTLAQYSYDALNRLEHVKDGPTGTPIETFDYDATGNRTSVLRAGVITAYAYPASSHRLSSVGGMARSYDAAGNTTGLSSGTGYAYNDAGRLALATHGSVVEVRYGYNGKGEQVRRTQGTDTTYYVYDEAGRMLGEYGNAGGMQQQVIWFGNMPVGVLHRSGAGHALHYIEPDHLGTPRVIIDGIRNVPIWTWSITGEAFGSTPPDEDPDNDGIAFAFDLRYPGQRYDNTTGLNYNYFRDYDPSTGRHVQSDPIGLEGGISTYAYVGGNPLGAVDPLGLARVDLGGNYTGRVDTFNYGGNASFEIHVYDPRGAEVGVYGPGGWINKHGHKGAPRGLPDGVEAQCKTVSDDYLHRTGLAARRASKGASRLKSFFKGWPLIGPMIEMTTPSPNVICDQIPDYPGCEAM